MWNILLQTRRRRTPPAAVLAGGLGVVAGLTKALPVGGVPKESGVASVRDDVIDHISEAVATGARWMGGAEVA